MVRTRFAPSPTGYLHIGGVRTALFNWLFARKHGGRFILRVDDTDQTRNIEAALQPILDGLRWLGLDWDEGPEVGGDRGPYRQSERADRYAAAVKTLLDAGVAYTDYATPEEIQVEREAAQVERKRFLYSRRFRATKASERAAFEAEGRRGIVRLEMPREGSCRFRDLVRGDVEVEWASEQDHVIQRADGSFLYHLANVVDDHDMEISHVIRAEEHLSNTARQIFIAQGLGYELPLYGHVPLVAEPGSRNKLSKRKLDKYLKIAEFAKVYEHGLAIAKAAGIDTPAETFHPVIVDFYEKVGYRPHAIVNYLLLLGWALDDRTEYFTRAEMIEAFSLERVNKAPASFDPGKLMAFEAHYMKQVSVADKARAGLPYLEGAGVIPSPPPENIVAKAEAISAAAGDRIRVAGDFLEYSEFFLPDDDLAYDEKAFEKRLRKPTEAAGLLDRFKGRLERAEPFDAGTLEETLQGFLAAEGIKIGQVIHALRVAVTGKAVGFGMFESLVILGRERCIHRIERALARV